MSEQDSSGEFLYRVRGSPGANADCKNKNKNLGSDKYLIGGDANTLDIPVARRL